MFRICNFEHDIQDFEHLLREWSSRSRDLSFTPDLKIRERRMTLTSHSLRPSDPGPAANDSHLILPDLQIRDQRRKCNEQHV
jgi:hypothetical protein